MKKVLLVDDIHGSQKNTGAVDYLRSHGHYVNGVTTAKNAWEKVNSSRYDIIIIDASEDKEIRKGFTLNEMITEYFPNTRRICWTAIPGAEYDPLLRNKFDIVISKPIKPSELVEIIENLI